MKISAHDPPELLSTDFITATNIPKLPNQGPNNRALTGADERGKISVPPKLGWAFYLYFGFTVSDQKATSSV